MKRMMTGLAVLAAAVLTTAGVRAQAGGAMAHDSMAHGAAAKTYVGCVEAGSQAGAFTLTHVAVDRAMSHDSMGKDSMGHDAMGHDSMGKGSMAKDAMAPESLKLGGTAVDFGKHVGHKVSVTGTAGKMGDFTVKSLKMIAASCQ